MKSLSLSRPLIIMMVGHPGAGKSFFASQFAETFNAPRISIDRMRSEIFTNPTYSKDEDELIKRITDVQVEELAKTNKTFIVDGGCNVKLTRQEYERIARSKGYGTLIIWVQTDGPSCQARALKRSPTRVGDKYNPPMSPEAFVSQVKRLTPPTISENTIVISGKHTYATQLRVVLKRLVPNRDTATDINSQAPVVLQRPNGDLPPKPRRVTIN